MVNAPKSCEEVQETYAGICFATNERKKVFGIEEEITPKKKGHCLKPQMI